MSYRVAACLLLSLIVGCSSSAKKETTADNALTEAEKKAGWQLLFNGRDLTGWTNSKAGVPIASKVEDGSIIPFQSDAYLIMYDKKFGNFKLQYDVKAEEKEANSGLFFRVGDPAQPVQTGLEVQIFDGGTDYHDFGAIYDLVPPSKNMVKPLGEWNHVELTCKGPKIEVAVNGEKIAEMDCDKVTEPGKRPDGTDSKFKMAVSEFPREGYIGFQDHGHKVWIKNVKILEL